MPTVAVAVAGTIAGAAAKAAIAGTAFQLTTGLLVKAAFSGLLAGASSLLSKKDKAPSAATPFKVTARDRKVTIRSAVSEGQLLYGTVKVGGTLPMVDTTGTDNKYMHLVRAMSHRPVTEIQETFFFETPVSDPRFRDRVRITNYDGTQTEADPDLVAELDGWTTDHVGYEVAYQAARLENDPDVFLSGVPEPSTICRGHALYDPREPGHDVTDWRTWSWSDNAALALLDYVLSEDGLDADPTLEIGWDHWIAAANRSDDLIDIPGKSSTFNFETHAASTVAITGFKYVQETFGTNREGDPKTRVVRQQIVKGYEDHVLLATDTTLETGDVVRVATAGTPPAPLQTGIDYFAIVDRVDQIRFATTYQKALAGDAIDLSTAAPGDLQVVAASRVTMAEPIDAVTGEVVEITSTGTLPAPLTNGEAYVSVSPVTGGLLLCASYDDAHDRKGIDFTGFGSGTLTMRRIKQRRFTCNGTIQLGDKPRDNIEKLLGACGGVMSYVDGQYRLHIGGPDAPVLTITEDMLAPGPIVFTPEVPRINRFNTVTGTYSGPLKSFEPTDYTRVTDPAFVAEDDGEEIIKDLDLDFANDDMRAQRVVRILLNDQRQQMTGRLPCDFSVWGLEPYDVVLLDLPTYGMAQKRFRVHKIEEGSTPGEAPLTLTLKEDAASVFDIGPADLQQQDPTPNTSFDNPLIVTPPTIGEPDSGTAQIIGTGGNALMTRIRVPLTPPANGFVTTGGSIQVRYRKVTETTLGPYEILTVEGSATEAFLHPVEDLATYEIDARSVSTLGPKSAWSASIVHTVIGKSERPADAVNLFRQGDDAVWEYPDKPIDFAGFRIRVHSGKTRNWDDGEDWPSEGAILQAHALSLMQLGAGVRTIMVRAIDTSGILSANPAILTVNLGEPSPANLILTHDEAALGFPGQVSNGQLVGGDMLRGDILPGDPYLPDDGALYLPNDLAAYLPTSFADLGYAFSYSVPQQATPASLFLTAATAGDSTSFRYRRRGTGDVYLGNDDEPYLPDGAGLYLGGTGPWQQMPARIDVDRETLDFTIEARGPNRRAEIASLMLSVDVPDVVESFQDLVIDAAGTRLPITKTYRVIKFVGAITLQDDGNGATGIALVDKDPVLGPLLKAVGAPQATVDIENMKGY